MATDDVPSHLRTRQNMQLRHISVSIAVSAFILLSACKTTGSSPAPVGQPVRITVGMSSDRLLELLGKPDQIEAVENKAYAETWIYLRTSRQTRMTQTSMRETVVFDPHSSELRSIQEPVTTPVTHQQVDRLEIYLVMSEIVGWKQDRTSGQEFTRQ